MVPLKRVDFDRVHRLARDLDDVELGTAWGAPALKVGGKMFACVPTQRSAEPDSIVVRVSFTERDFRISAEPATYYLKPHYEGYPCVLARVPAMSDEELRDLLQTAWRFVRTTKRGRGGPKAR